MGVRFTEAQLATMTARVHSMTPLRPHPLLQPAAKAAARAGRPRLARAGSSASPPHDLLWAEVVTIWPGAVREFKPGLNGRKFRIDIAFPDRRLAIEVDGFQYHGKHLGAFKADRDRCNLLTQHGWLILHYTVGRIRNDMPSVLTEIRATLERALPHDDVRRAA